MNIPHLHFFNQVEKTTEHTDLIYGFRYKFEYIHKQTSACARSHWAASKWRFFLCCTQENRSKHLRFEVEIKQRQCFRWSSIETVETAVAAALPVKIYTYDAFNGLVQILLPCLKLIAPFTLWARMYEWMIEYTESNVCLGCITIGRRQFSNWKVKQQLLFCFIIIFFTSILFCCAVVFFASLLQCWKMHSMHSIKRRMVSSVWRWSVRFLVC